jgi:hypothetical protein
MPNKWNKPDRVQSNVKQTRSSSGKQYQPINLSKQTKIHVLGDLDLKALITSTFLVPESMMRTVWIGGDVPVDRASARLEKKASPANGCRLMWLKDGAVRSFGMRPG